MTDDQPEQPEVDYFEQLESFAETAIPELIKQAQALIQNGSGGKEISHRCSKCGTTSKIQVADAEEIRKQIESLSATMFKLRQQRPPEADKATQAARLVLTEVREMNDEELAALIVGLRAKEAKSGQA